MEDTDITPTNSSASSTVGSSPEANESLTNSWHGKEDFIAKDFTADLPKTVTILDSVDGSHDSKVYLVGTAHFSEQSNRDVQETIRLVQPNVIVLELCKSRLAILSLDEKTLLEESSTLSLEKITHNIREQGLVQGVMYTLLLSLSAHLTRELGMAPGGEFRMAFKESKKIPGCRVQLGDRPVHLTLKRAISSLSVWQKMKLGISILFSNETISKEEVEKCKDKDLLQKMLQDITGEYPALSKVLVDERDTYLAYSLQLAAAPIRVMVPNSGSMQSVPSKVVGVVGIGHVPGIVKNWGTVSDSDITPLMYVPDQPWHEYIIIKGVKYSVNTILVVAAYRYLLPNSVKTVAKSSISLAWSNLVSMVMNVKSRLD